jgi:hypothetical protein
MKRPYPSILLAYLISRLICSLFVYLGHINRPYLSYIPGGWIGVDNWWLNPWTTYDSFWYLSIANTGYEVHTTAFFPLYPAILKLFGHDFLSMATVGIIFSHLAFLLALILIYKLTEKEHGGKIAIITIWVICFIPSAAFWGAVYTESLFLALLAGTFLAARNKQWVLCSILAALVALTRNPGVLMTIALYFEIRKEQPTLKGQIKKWYVPTAPLFAFAMVQVFYWWKFKNPFTGVISQEFFNRKVMWPWEPLLMDFHALFLADQSILFYFFTATSLLVTILALLFVIFGYRKLPVSYLILIGGITMMNIVYARVAIPSTISGIRYMGALFPFSQMLAIIYAKANDYNIIGPLLVSVQIVLFIFYSYYFGLKIAF